MATGEHWLGLSVPSEIPLLPTLSFRAPATADSWSVNVLVGMLGDLLESERHLEESPTNELEKAA